VNLCIAFLIGFITANNSIDSGVSISDFLIFSLAGGMLLQEILLVQVLSVEENMNYQKRLLKGDVSTRRRLQMLVLPFTLILMLGLAALYASERAFELSSIARVASVSLIFTLGIDPLFGLADRDYLAVFGAAVVYLLIIGSAIKGFGNLVLLFDTVFGDYLSFSLSGVTFCYLILSIRWTYYRLFCFEQIDEPTHVILESLAPVLLILLPSIPDLFKLVQLIYSGS
tara:strand:- start:134 stop:814 length:681 start_codon:yes stop_codon:yes gene_type:complete